MTSTVQRIYRGKDVDMLIAIATIVESADAKKTFLQTKRSNWADPFFQDLSTEIDRTINKYLGVDSAKALRQSTQVVLGIQANAINDLAELKVQLIEDFKDDKPLQNEILTQLGFNAYHKAAQKGDQEALIDLLFQFKTNLTDSLTETIVAKGTPATILDTITGYADVLKNANVTQEGNKGTRTEITAEGITKFNEIYSKVISVAKMASKFYKGDSAIQQQFSYTKVAKTVNASRKAALQPKK